MDSLRRRNPFKSVDEVDEDNHVFDEQEQEELIEDLRVQSREKNKNDRTIFQILIGISLSMHLLFFFGVDYFGETLLTTSRLLAFLQMLVHICLLVHLTPDMNTSFHQLVKDNPSLLPPLTRLLGLSCVAPAISLILGKSWFQTGWWSVTSLCIGAVMLMFNWNEAEEREISKLEKLKYSAGGA